ncbi:MAG: hypothetical protein KIT02_00245 [Devosia sp.]|uniref:hypothetical protein n=1 Tax=Devosia sp. TaxID=1871048 RepID=UPI0024CD7874|nr:hypothetical protein [Devosia sp.]UYN99714.1 MAG: hypothetical protein KIT02_00245 [Devosia sp.]
MNQTAHITAIQTPVSRQASGSAAGSPFLGLIDPLLVEEPVVHVFAGSVSRTAALAVWTWVKRDVLPGLADAGITAVETAAELERVLPQLLPAMKAALEKADTDTEAQRRLRAQIGRDDARSEVSTILFALRHRAVLAKAQGFGRAVNAMAEDAGLPAALQSMPLQDANLAAIVFHAAVGQVANPTRLVTAAIRLSGNATEGAIQRTGLGPMIDAFLAHAQNQIHVLKLGGPFADIDLVCRSLDRFHRLIRALTGYVEFPRNSRSTAALSAITKLVSDRVEPRLKEVVTDLNIAMRRPREGADRVDNDHILAAINGIYLLAAVRDCRDSLALNAIFDQAWSQSAQALELHIQRNLDLLRKDPDDVHTGARLDAAITMAQVRFNTEYADTLRRARLAAERRG